MGQRVCPRCQSSQLTPIPLSSGQALACGLPVLTIMGYQKCLHCGVLSERRAPAWIWLIGIAAGFASLYLFVKAHPLGLQFHATKILVLGSVALLGSIIGGARAMWGHARWVEPKSSGSKHVHPEPVSYMPMPATTLGKEPEPESKKDAEHPSVKPDGTEYECVFGGWIPRHSAREAISGYGVVRISEDAIAIGALEGGTTYVVDSRQCDAVYHPASRSYCVCVGPRRWISFRVSAPPVAGGSLIEGRLQAVLGKRFKVWTAPETTSGSLGVFAGVLLLLALLIAGVSLTHLKQPGARVGLLFTAIFGGLGGVVVRSAMGAAERERDISVGAGS